MSQNQSGIQAAVRAQTGTAYNWTGDFHALFDKDGIASGPFNQRLLLWINAALGENYTNLNGAMNAYAQSLGFANWNSLNTWGSLTPPYDPDAAAYIDATGELFPDALNTLVLGIKAAGLWDDHIGSIKKAIGVPSLAASMVDLRNPAFTGTPVNNPTQSATEGWGFTAASSQYIDSAWQCGAANSNGSQDSVHWGFRLKAYTSGVIGSSIANVNQQDGMVLSGAGVQRFCFNDQASARMQTAAAAATGHFIAVRSSSTARAAYKDGTAIGGDSNTSVGATGLNVFLGARNAAGTPDSFMTGRETIWHGGAALDATQAATLTALFDAYATAAGEA